MARSCNSQGEAPDLRVAIILSGSTCTRLLNLGPNNGAQGADYANSISSTT